MSILSQNIITDETMKVYTAVAKTTFIVSYFANRNSFVFLYLKKADTIIQDNLFDRELLFQLPLSQGDSLSSPTLSIDAGDSIFIKVNGDCSVSVIGNILE